MGARAVTLAIVVAVAATAPAAQAAPERTWLAGDLHVHTCFSHDAFCLGVDDPAEEPDQLYTAGLTVGQRFAEAGARGLDFLAITDHDDVRSQSDAGFGTAGVIGVPAYEGSMGGHAQMLGARYAYPRDPALAAELLRADGGVFQINHPGYQAEEPFDSCDDVGALHWDDGYDVRPDTIEVWNPTSPMGTALGYLECWLDRGAHVAVTAGSDSHWASTVAFQGTGFPTTWVLAGNDGVLDGLRAGRTTLTRFPPAHADSRLVIEARKGPLGAWTPVIGETVEPGRMLRIRVDGNPLPGFLEVRSSAGRLADRVPLTGPITLPAPASGWLYAVLHSSPESTSGGPDCEPQGQPVSTCAADHATLALTSPVYVGES